jgi:hypothetical protein
MKLGFYGINQELGVDRLVVLGLGGNAEGLIAFIEATASRA